MGFPLTDITVYYEGQNPELRDFADFRCLANYVCDYYHQLLHGYKPPKTSRICIHLAEVPTCNAPWYFGSICHIDWGFDEIKYLSISHQDRLHYILNIVHEAISKAAISNNWRADTFLKAYHTIVARDFIFAMTYPQKKSRDRKHTGQIIIEKTETVTCLYLAIEGVLLQKKVKLFEKKNWYWWDSAYRLAETAKWFNNTDFGVQSKKHKHHGRFSLTDESISGFLDFTRNDF